jgi:hypothetical protein
MSIYEIIQICLYLYTEYGTSYYNARSSALFPIKKNLMLKIKFKQSAHTQPELDHKHSF